MKLMILVFFLMVCTRGETQQSYPITFTHDGKTVYGTFTTPDGTGRFPTIIIAPGSGPNDRDGTLLLSGGNVECLYPGLNGDTLKPYKELADALVDSGYAVLRYDKLEYTYSAGTLGTITFHKLWLPVESAITYVKTRTDVDTNRLILLGHSEGSSLIPFIAKERNDIKALISVAGPRTPFDSILAYQLVHFEKLCDGDTLAAQFQADQVLNYFANIRAGNCSFLSPLFGVTACVWRDYLNATDPVAENYNLVNLPTLFLGLGMDINVPPAELMRFENEVTITDDFWTVPGVIHYMTPNNNPHVSEVLTDTILYWLRQHFLNTSLGNDLSNNSHYLSVSPNPFQDNITLTVEEVLQGDITISISDSIGKVVMAMTANIRDGQTMIDLGGLPKGQYYLKVDNGQIRASVKIVKQ